MYIRMGPTDKPDREHLHLDSILLHSREHAFEYIRKIEILINTLWPEEKENKE